MEKQTSTVEPRYILNAPSVQVCMQIQDNLTLFVFDNPSAVSTRHYFSVVRPRFRSKGVGEIKMLPVEPGAAAEILDNHLAKVLRLPKLEPFENSLEDIKATLKTPLAQGVLFKLVNNGLFGVEVLDAEQEQAYNSDASASPKLDFGSMFTSQPVFLRIKQWNDEGVELSHYLKVTMSEPSAVDQRALEHAQPLVRKRKGDFEHQEDVGACQMLFSKRVQSIDGAYYYPVGQAEVQPCTLEKRAEWISFVPYQIVSTVLAEEQTKGQLGND